MLTESSYSRALHINPVEIPNRVREQPEEEPASLHAGDDPFFPGMLHFYSVCIFILG